MQDNIVKRLALFVSSFTLLVGGVIFSQAAPGNQTKPGFKDVAQPVLKKYCVSCHSGPTPTAGVDFTKFDSDASVRQSPDIWTQAARYLASNHMPPEGSPQPPDDTRRKLVAWIQGALSSDCGLRDPGRVTIHRLNRAEYTNTVHDLLGVDFRGAQDFPSDDVGYGFDNISDLLSISPLLMEKYLGAAEQVASQAVILREGKTAEYGPSQIHYPPNKFASPRDEDLELLSEGTVTVDPEFAFGGHYKVTVSAYGDQAGPDPCNMLVTLDGQQLGNVSVKGHNRQEAVDFDFKFTAKSGKHTIGVAFTNDYYHPQDPDPKNRDRNLLIEDIVITGPELLDDQMPAAQAKIIPEEPLPGHEIAEAKTIFAKLATRAYRRPATPEEVARLSSYVSLALKNGDSFERGVQLGIEAMLVSPNFLFRVESDPTSASSGVRSLNGYEMASRLSYFLWSSMPDDTLLHLAANGSLQNPAVLKEQVARMLRDPKAVALTDNFATQWLTLSKLSIVTPDSHLYPDFNDNLRQDMLTETKDFFRSVVDNDRSVLDFLDAKYSFINQRLAQLYGIPGVTGDGFRKVSLEGTPRQGVLTQASFLTATSNPTRTSPVKRGKWVLEEILGTPPPPPPPGVGVLKDENNSSVSLSIRQMMEAHRANPMCAACHAKMDPLGFGFENFDGIGKWRTQDGKFAVDPSGVLPDGSKFAGPEGLIKILLGQKQLFVRCLSEKLLTYALGRGLGASDQCVLDDVVKNAAKSNYKFSSLITSIVLSDPFRKRHIVAAAPNGRI